jgi:hypothetical protein
VASAYVVYLRHPQTLAPLAVLDEYLSGGYTRRWQAPGEFQFQIGHEHPLAPVATLRNMLYEIRRDGVQEFAGVVKRIAVTADDGDEGSLVWTVSGPDLSGVFHKVLALPLPTQSDAATTAGADYDVQTNVPASTALRYYVDRNRARAHALLALGTIENPSPVSTSFVQDPFGSIPLIGGPNPSYGYTPAVSVGANVSYQARWQPMPQLLAEIAKAGGVGFRFRLDASVPAIYFDVLGAADRTAGTASGFTPMVFALGRDNLASFSYEDNGLDVENTLYVGGAGDGATRSQAVFLSSADGWWAAQPTYWYRLIGHAAEFGFPAPLSAAFTGFELVRTTTTRPDALARLQAMQPIDISGAVRAWGRQEAFLDVREGTTTAELERLATAYLAERADQQTASFQPLQTETSRYKVDWDLGDVVTYRADALGIEGNAAIHEVAVTLAADDEPQIAITVGEPQRDLVHILRDMRRAGHRPVAL